MTVMQPPALGHGVDLVAIDRIEEILERHGPQFRRRCFTEAEQAYAEAGRRRRAERYAARFACKEAVLKAIGTGWRNGIRWTDVSVINEPSGRPVLRLTGRCAELARKLGFTDWFVSLSHARGYAIASVIGTRGDGRRFPPSALPE